MCLSVSDHVFGTARPTSTKCLVNVRLYMAVARCSSGGVAIHYVLPVFMEDVIFAQLARRRRQAEAQCTRSLGLDYKLCAVIPAADQRTHDFHDDNIWEMHFSMLCTSCLELTTEKCSQ